MLEQFTWQQFLLAALVLILLWYAGIILLYYRSDISKFKPKRRQENKRYEREKEELKEEPEEDNLIGSIREPDGVTTSGMEELRFAPRAEDRNDPDSHRDTQIGAVPDVLEELKKIFSILEKEGGTKEDFISLFALVASKYPQIKGTPSQQALGDHIRNNLLFPISDEELDNLWQ